MYLFCYGTRPEIIKMFPLINTFDKKGIPYKTLFSGQHPDLFKQFEFLLPKPDYTLEDIMSHGQSLNSLSSKIMKKIDPILEKEKPEYVIIQGDTTTAYTIAMAAFYRSVKVIHLEAGLRTHNKMDPYPEEMNRCLISQLASIHLCPTSISVENLRREDITSGVYNVGNTVVDAFNQIKGDSIDDRNYLLVTLHRRENRGEKMYEMWDQLNTLSNTKKIIYITHPSLKEARTYLSDNIKKLDPVDYTTMVGLIKNCNGLITDSGGLQEEAVCAGKKVLVCRYTTERPETISSGWGKLVGVKILDNIEFLDGDTQSLGENPYGKNVCEKIVNVL